LAGAATQTFVPGTTGGMRVFAKECATVLFDQGLPLYYFCVIFAVKPWILFVAVLVGKKIL